MLVFGLFFPRAALLSSPSQPASPQLKPFLPATR